MVVWKILYTNLFIRYGMNLIVVSFLLYMMMKL